MSNQSWPIWYFFQLAFSILFFLPAAEAQFENDLGSQGTWVANSDSLSKPKIPLVLESTCSTDKIAEITQSERCVSTADPQACYFVAASQLEAKNPGGVAAAGMLGLALLSPQTAPAAIQDHIKIKKALASKMAFDLEFKRFGTEFVRRRIEIEKQFRDMANAKEVARSSQESDADYLERLIKENKKDFSRLTINSQLNEENAKRFPKPGTSWAEFTKELDARVFDELAQEMKESRRSPQAKHISADPRVARAVREIGSENPQRLLQALDVAENEIALDSQRTTLGDSLIKRRDEAQARIDLFNRAVAEKADPTFQSELKSLLNEVVRRKKELAEAEKSKSPMKILMAKQEVELAKRDLRNRIEKNFALVQKAMDNMRARSDEVQPALQALVNFDGSAAHLKLIDERLTLELRRSGLNIDVYEHDPNTHFSDELRRIVAEGNGRRAGIRKEAALEAVKAAGARAAQVSGVGLGIMAAPTLSFAKSTKLKSCAEKLELSDQELDFLLKQNPDLALLDRCDKIRLKNLDSILSASYVQFGSVPKGLCQLVEKQSQSAAALLRQKVEFKGCENVEGSGFAISTQDQKTRLTCQSKNVKGLTYSIPLDGVGRAKIQEITAVFGGIQRPMPAMDMRKALDQTPGIGLTQQNVNSFEYSENGIVPLQQQTFRYVQYLNNCQKNASSDSQLEVCSCASQLISASAISVVQSQFSNCASQNPVWTGSGNDSSSTTTGR